MPGTNDSAYIPTLDGWRAVAITAVLLFHGNSPKANALADQGYLGVMVFFCLSGFLITSRLQAEVLTTGKVDYRGFYIRRVFRIITPVVLFLFVLVLLHASGLIRLSATELTASVFFVRNFWGGSSHENWYTAHLWSLSVEEQFYLTWPWFLALGLRRAEFAALFLALGTHVWRWFTSHVSLPIPQGLAQPYYDYMMWGCWWALFLRQPARRNLIQKHLTLPVWLSLLALFSFVAIRQPRGAVFLMAFLIPLLLVGTILRPNEAPGRFLELPLVRWFGRISYALYLWQELFFVSIERPADSTLQVFPTNFLALLAVATTVHYLFERPSVALGYRLSQGSKS